MKAMIIAASLALASCNGVMPPPSTISQATILDERAAIATELAYKASRTALEMAVDAGLLKGEAAAKAAALDNRAYAAVQAVRAAYRAGNATSYSAAASDANAAVEAVLNAVKG